MNIYQKAIALSIPAAFLIAGYFHPQIILIGLGLLTIDIIFNGR